MFSIENDHTLENSTFQKVYKKVLTVTNTEALKSHFTEWSNRMRHLQYLQMICIRQCLLPLGQN